MTKYFIEKKVENQWITASFAASYKLAHDLLRAMTSDISCPEFRIRKYEYK